MRYEVNGSEFFEEFLVIRLDSIGIGIFIWRDIPELSY
jgi:hypothetical protein